LTGEIAISIHYGYVAVQSEALCPPEI
jgi:hypothetical protein